MTDKVEAYTFTWQGIEIDIVYEPNLWNVTSHILIESVKPERAPLPISETGFRSSYPPLNSVEEAGGDLIALVTSWLDEAAQSPKWQKHLEKSRQYELF